MRMSPSDTWDSTQSVTLDPAADTPAAASRPDHVPSTHQAAARAFAGRTDNGTDAQLVARTVSLSSLADSREAGDGNRLVRSGL